MTPSVSRWHSARSLINQLIPEFDDRMWFGLQRAPSVDACPAATLEAANCTDADVCLVSPTPEIELGEQHGAQILVSLPDTSASPLEIVGGSPLGAAWLSARDHLLAQDEINPRAVVLITDGGANCGEPGLPDAVEVFDGGLEAMVAEGYASYEILTVVVGVDVTERQPSLPAQPDSPAIDTHAALNALALAGGSPWSGGDEPRKYFDVRELDDLRPVFDSACGVTDCTVDLTMLPSGPPEPAQIPLITIEMEGVEVPYVVDCANENGWSWIVEGEILKFCGTHCEKFTMGDGPIEGFYGCPLPN
jgi:hypothetical protein